MNIQFFVTHRVQLSIAVVVATAAVFAVVNHWVVAEPQSLSSTNPPGAQTRPSVKLGRIAAGDLLSVRVFDLAGPGIESDKLVRVAMDGTIQPISLDPIKVSDLTVADAQAAIAKTYQKAQMIQQAVVLVRRLQLATASENDQIVAFDLMRISIGDLNGPGSETTTVVRVNAEGVIGLPYIGKQKLVGLTDQQAEKAVQKALADSHVVVKARVSVFRLEAAPADAAQIDLPDFPVHPIPEPVRYFLYMSQPQVRSIGDRSH